MKRLLIVCAAAALLPLAACGTAPEESRAESTVSSVSTSAAPTTTTTTAPLPMVGYCVADPSMHVRQGPGPYEEVIGGLAYGEQVTIVGREGDWYRIVFKEDYAYVSAQYIQDRLPSSTDASTTKTESVTMDTAGTSSAE